MERLAEGRITLRIVEHQITHHDIPCHLNKAASHEIQEFGIVDTGNSLYGIDILLGHEIQRSLYCLVLGGNLFLSLTLDPVEICAGSDVADSRHNLKLSGSLINRGDTCIAINLLACIIFHETGTAVDLDAVIGILIAEFRCHTLCKRGEGICKTAVEFSLFLLFYFKFALFGDIIVDLIHVYETRAGIKQRAARIKFCLHQRNNLCHRRELYDCLAELLALFGIIKSLAIRMLADTHTLGGDAETGAVHESHHIFDETELAAAYEFSRCVLVDKFACRTALDTHLVLDAANVNASVSLVIDKH